MFIFQHESPMTVTVISLHILSSAGGLQQQVVEEGFLYVCRQM